MASTLQIRSLTPALHRALKVRAAQDGVSMSDWVTARIQEALDRPSRHELLTRVQDRSAVEFDPTAMLRQERDGRDRALNLAAEPDAAYVADKS